MKEIDHICLEFECGFQARGFERGFVEFQESPDEKGVVVGKCGVRHVPLAKTPKEPPGRLAQHREHEIRRP